MNGKRFFCGNLITMRGHNKIIVKHLIVDSFGGENAY